MDLHTIHTQGDELFEKKFACKEKNCCDGKKLEDSFTVKQFEKFLCNRETIAWNGALDMVREKVEKMKFPIDHLQGGTLKDIYNARNETLDKVLFSLSKNNI